MRKKALFLSVAALSLSMLTACSNTNVHADGSVHTPGVIDYSVFDKNAVMFAQMMIPHHDQAVTLAEMAAKKSSNADVLSLANQIKFTQEPEILQMAQWLKTADAPLGDVSAHAGHMDGMLTDADLAELEAASGTDFDALWLKSMIKHHEGAIAMTTSLVQDSKNAEVANLARQIIENQTAEIEFMSQLLTLF